jgi:CBS domain containing-hemolysin-like protein
MEIAFVSANRLKIELDKKQNTYSSQIIKIFTKNPGQYISTMLVGNNIALVVYGIYFAKLFQPVIQTYISENDLVILFIQTLISTILILVTAEFLPKTIFRQNSNFLLFRLSPFVLFFYITLYPITVFSVWLSHFLIRLFTKVKFDKTQKDILFNKIDLDNFLSDNEENNEDSNATPGEVKIFRNALDFSDIKIRECIVPRNEIIVENIQSDIGDLKDKFIESGYSKIFIYRNTIDNIVGYVHISSIFKQIKSIKAGLNQIPIVPESMQANKLLNKLLKDRKSAAVVVDEFGGTSGIVTIEDIIEEIFGEIEDEHDETLYTEKQIKENEFIFSARMEIDYLNEKYKLDFPESEEYETLAGYLFYLHGHMPEKNEFFETERFTFEILKINGPKIETVRLIVK